MKKKKIKKNPSNRKPISYSTEFRLDINLNNFIRKLCPAMINAFQDIFCYTGHFTKKVFSDLADGFNIALVDCSTDFYLLSTFIVYTFELQQSPNQTIFPSILFFSQNSRPLRRKYLFRETPCTLHL